MMPEQTIKLARLYLPLLAHQQADVRVLSSRILRCIYGPHTQDSIRSLLYDNDVQVRDQAHKALESLESADAQSVPIEFSSPIYIQCLGQFKVSINGHILEFNDWDRRTEIKAGWQKVRSVFAYLVHCGRRGTTRQTLAKVVWGNKVNAGGIARTLAALRDTLIHTGALDLIEEALIINDDYCILNPDVYQTDAKLFANTFDIAAQTEITDGLDTAALFYTQALDLYNGPYMIDVGHGGWMQEQRSILVGHFINACERRAEHAYNQGNYRPCIALCLQALDADLGADDVTVWLLRAYAALGQMGELNYAYRAYLRAVQLNPHSKEAHDDVVVAEYEDLTPLAQRLVAV